MSGRDNQVVATTTDNAWPWGFAADPKTQETWVTGEDTNTVAALSGPFSQISSVHAAGPGPMSIVFDPLAGAFYIADSAATELTVLNSTDGQFVATVTLPDYPVGLAFDPSNGVVYVAGNRYPAPSSRSTAARTKCSSRCRSPAGRRPSPTTPPTGRST